MYELEDIKGLSLDIDVLNFTSEFIRRMREHPDVPSSLEPSTRQAIAIPTLLSGRRMRRGCIGAEDFVLAAVATSCVENQDIAYKVAMGILLGKQSEKRREEDGKAYALDKMGMEVDGRGRSEIPQFVEKGKKVSGSGVGGGDERFLEWVRKFRGDKEYRRRIIEMAERISLACNSRCESTSASLVKEDSGILYGEKVRYFQPGDDPSLIDFEESIENIISQCKRLSEIRYEDFIVRERRGQRMAVVLLEDISGSMSQAIKYSMTYVAILLYAFRKHEIALGFFESNPYAVKEFFDKKSVEETIESVLSARTRGGTKGGHILRWARDQLEGIDERYYEKMCIVCGDMGFHDIEEVAAEIKRMRDAGIKVVIILPPASTCYEFCVGMVENAKPIIVELDRDEMAKFPEIMSEVILG